MAHVLQDSGARVVIAEDYEAVRSLWRIRARIRDVTKVVQIDGDYPDARVLSLEGLLGLRRGAAGARAAASSPSACTPYAGRVWPRSSTSRTTTAGCAASG